MLHRKDQVQSLREGCAGKIFLVKDESISPTEDRAGDPERVDENGWEIEPPFLEQGAFFNGSRLDPKAIQFVSV